IKADGLLVENSTKPAIQLSTNKSSPAINFNHSPLEACTPLLQLAGIPLFVSTVRSSALTNLAVLTFNQSWQRDMVSSFDPSSLMINSTFWYVCRFALSSVSRTYLEEL